MFIYLCIYILIYVYIYIFRRIGIHLGMYGSCTVERAGLIGWYFSVLNDICWNHFDSNGYARSTAKRFRNGVQRSCT